VCAYMTWRHPPTPRRCAHGSRLPTPPSQDKPHAKLRWRHPAAGRTCTSHSWRLLVQCAGGQ
jgi:hypothetical protein